MSSQLNAPSSPSSPQGFLVGGPADLSRDYGVTRLVLMPRDPHWMHAYWEVAPYTWDEVEQNFGREVRASGRPVLRCHSLLNGDKRSFFDIGVQLEARNWYVFSSIRGGTWQVELGLVLPDGRFVLLAISNTIQLPAGQVSELEDEKRGLMKAEWEKIYELSGGGRVGVGSLEMAKISALRWEFLRGISSWFGGAPGSASWARPREMHKGFWLVADCELIVYGATEPDAHVTVQGQDIQLNPDGTFSMRFALPDGLLGIPIQAVNRDGDMSRAVEFAITRKTQ
ncbi:MAG: DUF4912 domain-containing protein [Elusimicrobia bacterium]|nr:DUF4912 domain-containing protein [Elusimicrobiota bacterium]